MTISSNITLKYFFIIKMPSEISLGILPFMGYFMRDINKLKNIIIAINENNEKNLKDISSFFINMKSNNIKVLFFDNDAEELSIANLSEDGTFLFTDNIKARKWADKYKIGCAIYDNKASRCEELGDVLYRVENLSDIDYETANRMLLRHLRLPWEIGRTDRCLIREITEEDIDDLYKIYEDKSVTEYMEDLFEDRQEELNYIRYTIDKQYRFYEFGMWIVEDLLTGEVIGRAGIDIREGYEDPEVGFVIKKEYRNKGLAYEVMSWIVEYARESLSINELNAFADKRNEKSVKLLKKLGFHNVKDSFWKLYMV